MASSGNVVVVGGGQVPMEDPGDFIGLVYVYEYDGASWTETAQLTQSVITDPGDPGGYGASVATSGDIIAVGNPKDNDCEGRIGEVFVYEKMDGNWVETGFLTGDFGSESENESFPYCFLLDFFGYQVSISGGTIAVGSEQDEDSAIFFFEKVDGVWKQTSFLSGQSDFPSYGINLQRSVLDPNGLLLANAAPDGAKSLVMFELRPDDSWQEVARLSPSDAVGPGEPDDFGFPFATDGSVIVVGGRLAAVYVFEKVGGFWQETQKLPFPGTAVAVYGNVIVVGSGSQAVVFQKFSGSWMVTAKLTGTCDFDPDGVAVSEVGIQVASSTSLNSAAYFYPICEFMAVIGTLRCTCFTLSPLTMQ